MRAVVQRARRGHVAVAGEIVGRVSATDGGGLVVLLGATHGDDDADARWLADKICGLRIFNDADGKMNRSLVDVGGGLLVISQFTLYGDCRKGRRPSFVKAMDPQPAARLVDVFVARAATHVPHVETGIFGADMQVDLINDGPVTLILDSPAKA